MPLAVLTPDYTPPDTLSAWEKRHIDPLLDSYTHIAIVDRDVTVDDEFYTLPNKLKKDDPDIITVDVKPSSLIFDLWERLTYWIAFETRHRGCAVIYSTRFLKEIGGWPMATTPDTVLWQKARFTVSMPVMAVHHQSFNWMHSVHNQIRDGKSRAELHYPFWKTLLHSIFRFRPLVLFSYLRERLH